MDSFFSYDKSFLEDKQNRCIFEYTLSDLDNLCSLFEYRNMGFELIVVKHNKGLLEISSNPLFITQSFFRILRFPKDTVQIPSLCMYGHLQKTNL